MLYFLVLVCTSSVVAWGGGGGGGGEGEERLIYMYVFGIPLIAVLTIGCFTVYRGAKQVLGSILGYWRLYSLATAS